MSENLLSISNHQFDDVIAIIVKARSRAMKAVNAELINMYLEIGAYVSERVKQQEVCIYLYYFIMKE